MSPKINSPSPTTSRMLLAYCIVFITSFFVLTEFNRYAHANLLKQDCSASDTYAIGSTFESNIANLLSSLYENAIINSSFSYDFSGSSPNEVYGLLMCFVDSSLADCINCLQNATSNRTKPCSKSETAIVWYDSCTLSYSSNDFHSVADSFVHHISNPIGSLDETTQKSLMNLLTNLSETVPYTPEMFSKQVVTNSFTKMAALMQCTRDLSPQECSNCFEYIMSYFSSYSVNGTALSMRLMTRNCSMKYELSDFNVSSFPKSLVPPPPPPSPPSLPLPARPLRTVTKLSSSGGEIHQVFA